jgi:hypothetical protein
MYLSSKSWPANTDSIEANTKQYIVVFCDEIGSVRILESRPTDTIAGYNKTEISPIIPTSLRIRTYRLCGEVALPVP